MMMTKKKNSFFTNPIFFLMLSFLTFIVTFFGFQLYLNFEEETYQTNWKAEIVEKNKVLTAIHEAGHALLVLHFPALFNLTSANIQGEKNVSGYVAYNLQPDQKETPYYEKLLITLAGNKAVETILGDQNLAYLNYFPNFLDSIIQPINSKKPENLQPDIVSAKKIATKLANQSPSQTVQTVLETADQAVTKILMAKQKTLLFLVDLLLETENGVLSGAMIKQELTTFALLGSDSYLSTSWKMSSFAFYQPLFKQWEVIYLALLIALALFFSLLLIRAFQQKKSPR